MHGLDSSSIEAIGYDAPNKRLFVRFVESQTTYSFYEVPQSIFEAFLRSTSAGRFFQAHVRNSFGYDRIGPIESDSALPAE